MKKSLSLLLVLAMLVSLLAGLGVPTLAAESDAALTLYVQNEGEAAVPVKSYTADELAALAEKSDGAAYVYYKKDAANAVVATEYVTLSALLADAALDFGPAQKLAFECADGPYAKGDFSYETMAQRGEDAEGNAVPTAIALTWGVGSLEEATVADIAAKAENTGSLRFVSGMTAEEAEGKTAAGNRMPSDVLGITIVTPEQIALEVYTQAGKGAPENLVKAYTASELATLAETDDGAVYVYSGKSGASAVVATEYVTLDALLTDAGVSFAEGDALAFTCNDGPYAKYQGTYADLSARGVDAEGNPVPTAFALTWETGALEDAAAIAAEAKNTGNIRFVSGMTADEAKDNSGRGMRMPSGVISVTVIGLPVVQPSSQGLKVDGADKTTEVYNISGYNYFKLRDIAALLTGTDAQFDVSFDAEKRTVYVETGKAYTPIDGDLTTGTDKSDSCVLSDWKVEVNGEVKDIVAYNLGGNNFFKLADLGSAIGFGVAYDETTRTMLVTSK